jgi:hypothetical protein
MRTIAAAAMLSAGLAAATPCAAQSRWWQSPETRARLGLTDTQSRELATVYEGVLPERTRLAEKVARLNAKLDEALFSSAATEDDIKALADQVASVEAQRRRVRFLMLYRMRRILTADQRAMLRKMYDDGRREDRRRRDRPYPGPGVDEANRSGIHAPAGS